MSVFGFEKLSDESLLDRMAEMPFSDAISHALILEALRRILRRKESRGAQ